MNYNFIIQIIVVLSAIILVILLYPQILKAYKRFIDGQHKLLSAGEHPPEEEKPPVKTNESPDRRSQIPSFVGKSKFKVGHDRTNTATIPENEKVIEKEDTFADDSQNDSGLIKEVDVLLESTGQLPVEEFSPEEEEIGCETGHDAQYAGGASYEELMQAGDAIRNKDITIGEKEEAGRIFYQNRSTDMVEQIVSKDDQTLAKVNELIALHTKKYYPAEQSDAQEHPKADDFESFDINSIF